jgi:hypothetical protein
MIGLTIALFAIDFFTLTTASTRVDFEDGYYTPICIFTGVVASVLATGMSFPELRTSNKSINYLLLPASNMEKFLVQFIIRIIGFALLFLPLFWLIFKLAYALYNQFIWENPIVVSSLRVLSPFEVEDLDSLDSAAILSCIIATNLFGFTGAIFFKKYALFKSIVLFALIIAALLLLMVGCSHAFFPEYVKDFFEIKKVSYRVYDNIDSFPLFLLVLSSGTSLLLIPMAYFKLKEMEV